MPCTQPTAAGFDAIAYARQLIDQHAAAPEGSDAWRLVQLCQRAIELNDAADVYLDTPAHRQREAQLRLIRAVSAMEGMQ